MISVTGTQLMSLEPGEGSDTGGLPPAPPTVADAGLSEAAFDAILADQRRGWLAGQPTPAAAWLDRQRSIASVPALAAELVYHEFTLRQELGESPEWEDYLSQFANYAEILRLLRKADAVVGQTLIKTGSPSGCQFGDYELLGAIGRGGMGIVYKARQRSLDRLVAVKMIRSGSCASEEERRRFQVEAEAVARLRHPNIVHIYEVSEADGEPFLVLEFVEGDSLARRLGGDPLGPRPAAVLVETLARAVEYAHGMGVVHRDLKPSNVLVEGTLEAALDGCVPKITDFGLAKRLDKTGWTRSDAVLGTPSYMAPEQAASKPATIDARTDVYGLGAILYEMLTGRPPFRAESPLQTLKQVVEIEPARPRLVNPGVPRDLETVCLKCLEKDPQRRYSSAAAVADDLGRWLRGEPLRARRVGALGTGLRLCRRKPVIAGLLGLLILSVTAGLWASWLLTRRAMAGEARAVENERREGVARQEAEANAHEARQILADLVRFGPDAPSNPISFICQPPDTGLLVRAEEQCGRMLRKTPEDTDLRIGLTKVRGALGGVYCQRGQAREGEEWFRQARELWEGLAAGNARQVAPRYWLATAMLWQAGAAATRKDCVREFSLRQSAFILWQELVLENPSNPDLLLNEEICRRDVIERVRSIRHDLQRSLQGEMASLSDLVRDRPDDRALRHRLALTHVLLAEIADGQGGADRGWSHRQEAYRQFRQLAAEQGDDLPARLALAHSCSQLMRPQISDPYYLEAIAIFEQALPRVAAVLQRQPGRDLMPVFLMEDYCCLVMCHARAGAADSAGGLCRKTIAAFVKGVREQSADPHASVSGLAQLSEGLRAAGQLELAREIASEAASVFDRYTAIASQDPGFSRTIAESSLLLSALFRHLGEPMDSLRHAEIALNRFHDVIKDSPDVSRLYNLSDAWVAIGKARWDLGQADGAVAALWESVAAERRAVELAPGDHEKRARLSRCLGRLIDCGGGHCGSSATIAKALLEQEKLWHDNANELMEVSDEFRKLAAEVGQGKQHLKPEEQAERQGYLDHSTRIKRAAEAIRRTDGPGSVASGNS
jgi:tetratricopeptide (TPR) repeat protein/tRNA A-37 threonylcarbamoyl transferase component Bud32